MHARRAGADVKASWAPKRYVNALLLSGSINKRVIWMEGMSHQKGTSSANRIARGPLANPPIAHSPNVLRAPSAMRSRPPSARAPTAEPIAPPARESAARSREPIGPSAMEPTVPPARESTAFSVREFNALSAPPCENKRVQMVGKRGSAQNVMSCKRVEMPATTSR